MTIERDADTSEDTGPSAIDATADIFERIISGPSQEDTPPRRPSRPAEQEADADEAEALDADTEEDASEDAELDGLDPDDAEADETEGEGEDQADDAVEAVADPKAKVTVKIGDKTESLTVEELTKGYQRQSDYSRKTAEVAEARKAIETELSDVKQERAQYGQLLTALAAQLDGEQQPNWAELRQENPEEYLLKRDEWQQKADKRRAIHAEQARLAETHKAEQMRSMQEIVTAERDKLFEAKPAWKDEKVFKRDRAAIREYGLKNGWTNEELDGATDHRAILALEKAMKFDRLVEKRAKATPATPKGPQPKPLRPGTSNKPSPANRGRSEAFKRLSKSGSVKDAARVFETLI
jgi:hypothetical protein